MKNNNNIEFHIIGDGIKLERLKQLTTDCKNIKYYGWQPQSKMNEIYSYCDIEIIPLHRGVIGNNVPSKTALALACGKRIISIVEESHYYHLFEDNGVGFSFSHLEMNELKDKLVELSMMKKQEPVFNQKCIDFSKKYYSKQANVELLTRIIYQKNQNI